MLSQIERQEIREEVYRDLAEVEYQIAHYAGSYDFLCLVGGAPTFTHNPIGPVLRFIPHLAMADCALGA